MGFRILNFCGGGVRGLMSAVILQRLDTAFRAECGKGLVDQADMIAGTSTGSLITGLLLVGATPGIVVDFYHLAMIPEFKKGQPSPDQPLLPADWIVPLLDKFHLDLPISNIAKKALFTSFDIGAANTPWAPQLFNNFPGSANAGIGLLDAMLGSGAMPGMASPLAVELGGRTLHLIDGAFVHHDPTVPAIALAVGSGVDLADISAIDIGTGFMQNFISTDTSAWGSNQWLHGSGQNDGMLPPLLVNIPSTPANESPILNLCLNGTSTNLMPDLAGLMLGNRFAYLNPDFGSRYVPEDAVDPADIDFLVAEANACPIDDAMTVLRTYWVD